MNINKRLIFSLSTVDIDEFEDLINTYYGDSDCIDLYIHYDEYSAVIIYHTYDEYFVKLNNYGVYLNRKSYKFTDLQNWKSETILQNIKKS